jgi:hypothetical protein
MVLMSRSRLATLLVLGAVLSIGCAGPGASPTTEPPGSLLPTTSATEPPATSPTTPAPSTEPTEPPFPVRTVVEVNSPIVNRPGIPADLADGWWWSALEAGSVGTTAQLGVPVTERVLHADAGLVVSARYPGENDVNGGPVTIVVRDIATGSLIREIATSLRQPVAMVIGRRLFWAGEQVNPPGSNDALTIDGGIWESDIDGTSRPIAVVPGGTDITNLNYAGRTAFDVSPSGRTLASGVGGFAGRWTDIIDVEGLRARTRLDGDAVYALTDDTVLVPDHAPSDVGGGGVFAKDIATGQTLWQFPKGGLEPPAGVAAVEALGSRFVVQLLRQASGGDEFVIGSLDPVTGTLTDRLVRSTSTAVASMSVAWSISSDRTLVLSTDGVGSAIADGTPLSILDLTTGAFTRDAFVIGTPWFCYPEIPCRREPG